MGILKHKPSDYPSPLLWFLDETHVTVTAGTALAIAWTRDAHAAWFGAGALASTIVARIAKRVIKQPRPPPPSESEPSRVRPKRTSGMPSTHSTALAFYLVYLWPLLPLVSTSIPGLWIERIALAGITGLGLWSRVKLGYHTVPQVFVGIATGGVSALAWKQIWKTYPAIEPWLQNLIDRAVGLVF